MAKAGKQGKSGKAGKAAAGRSSPAGSREKVSGRKGAPMHAARDKAGPLVDAAGPGERAAPTRHFNAASPLDDAAIAAASARSAVTSRDKPGGGATAGYSDNKPPVAAAAREKPLIRPADVLSRLASLKTMDAAELKAQWRKLFDREPPPYNRRFLESRLAYRIQELAFGGLKEETVRYLEKLGEALDGGDPALRSRSRLDNRPIAGTKLIRDWRGVEHVVTVLCDGYEWEGRPYKSLSAIANAITGTRWNGFVFFGLKNQRTKPAPAPAPALPFELSDRFDDGKPAGLERTRSRARAEARR